MTWQQVATFAWGTCVVLADVVVGPVRRRINHHRRSIK